METSKAVYVSPIGTIEIVGNAESVLALNFVEGEPAGDARVPDCLLPCVEQIDEYFKGDRKAFSLPLKTEGTAFQQQVWRQLERIPYGEVSSYGDVARAIGKPKACRAVGSANHRNPIAIIIPCHRVIGSDGSLTGYGGGLWRKEWLLNLEANRLD
jgi:methylated-DNA-[protein]-cysteine S-methyltransferase